MAWQRFYVPTSFDVPNVELTGQEAHHLIHVLRAQVGETVELFDGRGAQAAAEIVMLSKRTANLRIVESRSDTAECASSIVLGTAVPKGDRFRWLVEKATELGVARLVPLRTKRSVVDPGSGKLQRMRQTVIEACKQCGRSRLMQIDAPTDWPQVVAQEFPGRAVFVADPRGTLLTVEFLDRFSEAKSNVVLAIGPEGGFSEDEISLATDAGAKLINLGPWLLRIETAAIALAAMSQLRSQDGCRNKDGRAAR